jgi:hypothetical protein
MGYGCIIMNEGCGRVMKEAVVAYFREISRQFRTWTAENHDNPKAG